jgi:hypothetical protein
MFKTHIGGVLFMLGLLIDVTIDQLKFKNLEKEVKHNTT